MKVYEVVYSKWYSNTFPDRWVRTLVKAESEDDAMTKVVEMVEKQNPKWIVNYFLSVELVGENGE